MCPCFHSTSRYAEHYCKFSLQPNEYKQCYCVLPNNCSQLTFLKRSCSLARWFATTLPNSRVFGVNLYEIFRIHVSSYEEPLWKISLQTNKYAKSYRVGVYICQSALGIFDWMTHICVIPQCSWMYDAYASISIVALANRIILENFK